MGTLDQVINISNNQTNKQCLFKLAKEAEDNNDYHQCTNFLIESIKQNKEILTEKPQNKVARQTLMESFEMLATLNPFYEQFNLPSIPQIQRKKYPITQQILSFFKEKNWESQCMGKFGGSKPASETWKSFYLDNESTFNKLKTNDKKLLWAIKKGHIKIVSSLIKKHKSLIKKNEVDLLETAIKNNYSQITKLLIEYGASVNATNKEKWTPLHWACMTNNQDIIKYLITHKAKINAKDKKGIMPIHIACLQGKLDLISLLAHHKAHLNTKEKVYELTPIQLAAKQNHLDCVNMLIDLKANTNVTDITGKSLIHWAASQNHTNILEKLLTHQKGNMRPDLVGRLPIHWAAQCNALDCIKVLIQHQHNLNQEDIFNYRPLLIAAFFKHTNAFTLLFENGAR